MKKVIFLITLLGLGFIYSCDHEDSTNLSSSSKYLSMKDFEQIGKIHNDFLQNYINCFPDTQTIDNSLSLNNVIDAIADFQIEHAKNYFEDTSDYNLFASNMTHFKNLILSKQVMERCFNQNDDQTIFFDKMTRAASNIEDSDSVININDIASLYNMQLFLYDHEYIDNKGYSLLTDIITLMKKCHEDSISEEEFENQVTILSNKYNQVNFEKDSFQGYLIGSILAIGESSLTFWIENNNEIDGGAKIPTVVYADMGGAFVGAIGNMASQTVTNKKWSWKSFGFSVASGAISTSAGVAVKTGRIIQTIIESFT